jgi:MoxR-like ATPase
LPEAQLDRFLLYIKIGYPTAEEERTILESTTGRQTSSIEKVIDGAQIREAQQLVREIHISNDLVRIVSDIVRNTRPATSSVDTVKEFVRWGAGPRAGQAMILTAKARALMNGNLAVTREDLSHVAYPVLRHRILLNFRAEAEGVESDHITRDILQQTLTSRTSI